ncbi:MAG: hypothetical protein L3J75_12090 [Methylococcaceae bacterium]|nr:hypothetical protein [Methylococcaceae bacterium]
MTTTNLSNSTNTTVPLWQTILNTPFANTQYSSPFGTMTVTAWDGLAATAGLTTGYKIAQAADALRWAKQEEMQAGRLG